MEVHRVHHRRRRNLHAGDRLVAAIGHRELDAIADARADHGPGNLIPEGPRAELHPRRDFDDLVRRVEPDFLDGVRHERLHRRVHAERAAGGERPRVPLGA
jgi:hypothetical protein